MTDNNNIYIYLVQILFVGSISYGSQSLQLEELSIWGAVVARYILYLLIIKGSHEACFLGYNTIRSRQSPDWLRVYDNCKTYLIIFGASAGVLIFSKQKILQGDLLLLFIAYLISKYPQMGSAPGKISYGTGMACSFFEGYLQHVIPSDGGDYVGFEGNVTNFESRHGVVVPVKRLFIVITKSLYSPPDLKDFNKPNSRENGLSYLEARHSLQDVTKDVAGVKNRQYRNSVYKICRAGAAPVSLVAECATPLHTLHKVLEKRTLYRHLSEIDKEAVVREFCSTLADIIERSPECSGKCELVYYDDTDPNQNLADILLEKLSQLEPNFDTIRRT